MVPRAKDYGEAYDNHERVAKLWSSVLNINVSVSQVYMCLLLLKVARLVVTPNHKDSWIDIAGYASLGGEVDEKESSQISFLERLDLDTIEEDWLPPTEFPDLTRSEYIAIDLETNDPNLTERYTPGWARDDGFIVGIGWAKRRFCWLLSYSS